VEGRGEGGREREKGRDGIGEGEENGDRSPTIFGLKVALIIACVLTTEGKKKSIATTLRKRFGGSKDSARAQSVERLPTCHDSNLLRPPDSLDSTASTSRIPGRPSYRNVAGAVFNAVVELEFTDWLVLVMTLYRELVNFRQVACSQDTTH